MWPFKKNTESYKTKIIERIEYRSIEQKDFDQKVKLTEKLLADEKSKLDYERQKFEQDRDKFFADEKTKIDYEKRQFEMEKNDLINQAKQQLLQDAQKSIQILEQRQQDLLITDQEKQIYQEKLKQDPYIDLDKLPVPYYNIRQAIRRAHAY